MWGRAGEQSRCEKYLAIERYSEGVIGSVIEEKRNAWHLIKYEELN